MTVLVDSNVLLDVLTEDPDWCEWSSASPARAAEHEPLAINPVIYAEVSVGFDRIEDMEAALLTREASRYRTYFPKPRLLAP